MTEEQMTDIQGKVLHFYEKIKEEYGEEVMDQMAFANLIHADQKDSILLLSRSHNAIRFVAQVVMAISEKHVEDFMKEKNAPPDPDFKSITAFYVLSEVFKELSRIIDHKSDPMNLYEQLRSVIR